MSVRKSSSFKKIIVTVIIRTEKNMQEHLPRQLSSYRHRNNCFSIQASNTDKVGHSLPNHNTRALSDL